MQTSAVTPAAEEYLKLIPLDVAKQWLKVQHSQEDVIITACIVGAIQMAEAFCGLDFIPKTRIALFDDVDYKQSTGIHTAYNPVDLPFGPNQVITEVARVISGEEPEVIDTDQYESTGNSFLTINFNRFWSTRAYAGVGYKVTYDSGYAEQTVDSTELSDLKLALLQMVENFYIKRSHIETGTIVANVPLSARVILNQYVRNPVGV